MKTRCIKLERCTDKKYIATFNNGVKCITAKKPMFELDKSYAVFNADFTVVDVIELLNDLLEKISQEHPYYSKSDFNKIDTVIGSIRLILKAKHHA